MGIIWVCLGYKLINLQICFKETIANITLDTSILYLCLEAPRASHGATNLMRSLPFAPESASWSQHPACIIFD